MPSLCGMWQWVCYLVTGVFWHILKPEKGKEVPSLPRGLHSGAHQPHPTHCSIISRNTAFVGCLEGSEELFLSFKACSLRWSQFWTAQKCVTSETQYLCGPHGRPSTGLCFQLCPGRSHPLGCPSTPSTSSRCLKECYTYKKHKKRLLFFVLLLNQFRPL